MKFQFDFGPINFRKTMMQFLENGLFWMVLVLFAIGGITAFYRTERIALNAGSSLITTSDRSQNHHVGEKSLPIYSVKSESPQISLTFDATYGNGSLEQILGILSKHQVYATFFTTESWLNQYPQEAFAITNQGHDLGYYGEHDKNMSQLSPAEIKNEIQSLNAKSRELTGHNMELFRPPHEDYNNNVIESAIDLGFYPVYFNIDSMDWKDYGTQSVIDTVLNHPSLENGSIIRLHIDTKYTPSALDSIITGLEAKGYQLVPVSKMIFKDNYYLDRSGRQISGP